MKYVHFLRHAKSDWNDAGAADHARPLNARGVKAGKAMAAYLARQDFTVDLVLCSTARRARDTYALLGRKLRAAPVAFRDDLYLIPADDLLEIIAKLPETASSVLFIGHNPTFHEASVALAKRAARGQRKALAQMALKYPTAAVASICFAAGNWRQVKPGTGTLTGFIRPRDLEKAVPRAARKKTARA